MREHGKKAVRTWAPESGDMMPYSRRDAHY